MAKDIDPKLKFIGNYLKIEEDRMFVIPEYQRGYSWTISQCDKLWQDIESFMGSSSKDPYFFGTIIIDCSKEDEEKSYNLIDGQQRTTTFILLLKALLVRLDEVLKNFVLDEDSESLSSGLNERRSDITKILYKTNTEDMVKLKKDWTLVKNVTLLKNNSINEQYKNELKNILDAKTYIDAKSNAHKIYKKQKDNKYTNFFKNFKFFYNKLREYKESELNAFAKAFLEKCQVIEIKSWQVEQAITMFNSLNSTGMPLSDADIISARLYSNAGEEKSTFNKIWERVNDLAKNLSTRKIITIDSVLQQFMYINRAINKEYIGNGGNPDVTTPGIRNYYMDISPYLLKKPMDLCNHFEKIAQIWDKVNSYPIIKLMLKFNENIKLYLISYLYRFSIEEISEEKCLNIAECLIRLFTILELVDVGYSSSKFKTFLFGENIKLVDVNVTMDEIIKDFDKHIKNNWNINDIKTALNEYERNILVYLNEYLFVKYDSSKDFKFDFTESVNVEHIMPISGHNIETIRKDAKYSDELEFDANVNKLGNKILLEESFNKSLGCDWFKTKKEKYQKSKYNMAKYIANNEKWTRDEIAIATDKAEERIIRFLFN